MCGYEYECYCIKQSVEASVLIEFLELWQLIQVTFDLFEEEKSDITPRKKTTEK